MYATDGVQGSTRPTREQGSDGGAKEFAGKIQSQKQASVDTRNTEPPPNVAPNNVTPAATRRKDTGLVTGAAARLGAGTGGNGNRPAADGTNGKTDHVVQDGETLQSIAEDNDQTVDDVLLANPSLSEDAPLETGMTVALYDETRLTIARQMQTTSDPDRLKQLVMDEILYATEHSSTPEDLLPAVQADISARLGTDNPEIAAVLEERAAAATQLWRNQGRTHDVMDRLQALTAQGDSAALQQEIVNIFEAVATGTPTQEAVDGQAAILLAYGPQTPAFAEALALAETYFTTGRPQEAAAAIADAYTQQGPVAAAQLLADYTRAGSADPLTAARILNAAQPTVTLVIGHLSGPGWQDWPGNPSGESFYLDLEGYAGVFDNLNAAADNASLSTESTASIETMARLLNEQDFQSVFPSIASGSGVVLPLEMLKQSGDPLLADQIAEAINELKFGIRESVQEFAETAYPITGPALAWSGLVENPDAAFEATLDLVQPDGTTLRDALNADIARLNEEGRQMMRVVLALENYKGDLAEFPELLAAGAVPAEGADPAIELVLGSQGAFAEALRSANIQGLQTGAALDPYAFVGPGSFFSRLLGNTGRSFSQVHLGQTPMDFGSGRGLGLGLTLYRAGTYASGFAANVNDPGWRAQGLTGLNVSGVLLEGAVALSGLYANSQGLTLLTQAELNALTPLQRQIALTASADYVWREVAGTMKWAPAQGASSLLLGAVKWHLRAFGALNIVSSVDSFANGSPVRGFASLLAGTGTIASTSAPGIASLLGVTAARVALWGNVATLIGSGILTVAAIHEENVRRGELENHHINYLVQAGVDPDTARALVNLGDGPLVAPALKALSDHLELSPGELLEALAAEDPQVVANFRYWFLQELTPNPDGSFNIYDRDGVRLPPDSLEDLISVARDGGIDLPDHRYAEPPTGPR